ncbi:MAG: ATP-binding cassette domain-containing protein [Eubacterium sp.]|nr:ATP-binding cassette domain-containing protein [Eubacterium sp.]
MSEIVISIEGLEKSYGKHKVLRGVDMHVKKGDIYGLIGKNGAGKTTLFKNILGLSDFESGKLSIFGGANEKENNHNRSKIGFFVGNCIYDYLSGRSNLEYFRRLKGVKDKDEVDRVLEIVGLDSKAADTPAKKYSLGMKQRLGLAQSLLGNPELLIFDEPTNGLDPQGIMDVRNLLQKLNEEEGKTILVSSHILGELQNTAHRFGIIHDGVLMKELVQDDFRVQKNITSINVEDKDVEKAKALLEQNGIEIHGLAQATSSLEDYYFDLIGGGEDA